jgi:very-short-patch-repair endonuclease
MKQPSKNKSVPIKSKVKKKYYRKRKVFKKSAIASEKDGSGLETYFRINFLEKYGIEYIQQFEAVDIGRFYDFLIPNKFIIIECQGSYFHSDPSIYDKPINSMQRHSIKVDKIKERWALLHGYCLIVVWEKDIYKNPDKVIALLNEHINIQDKKIILSESKKDGTFYKKKEK